MCCSKRSALGLAVAILLLVLPSTSFAGWVYFPPALNDPAQIPAGGSILCRTYATSTTGVISPIYTNPFVSDTDGSGIQIETNGVKTLLSSANPFPPLTPEMTSFNSTPADQWFQLFDTTLAAQMFSYAFFLMALSSALAHGVGVLISMFNRRL